MPMLKLVLPEADETLLSNMQAALLIQVGVLGSDLVPAQHPNHKWSKMWKILFWSFYPGSMIGFIDAPDTQTFCTHLRAPSLLRKAKVPLTTLSTPSSKLFTNLKPACICVRESCLLSLSLKCLPGWQQSNRRVGHGKLDLQVTSNWSIYIC